MTTADQILHDRAYWKAQREKFPALFVRVTPEEREHIRAAAESAGKSISQWCRDALLDKAAAVFGEESNV